MNIISNCCAGGFMYKKYIGKFANPFIWNAITFDSIFTLITEYEKLNFKNVKLLPSNFLNMNDICKIVIDDKVELHYVHYRFLSGCTYMHKGLDIFKHDIFNYVWNTYHKRLERMLSLNEPPCFLICDNKKGHELTFDDINKISNLDTPYKIIIASDKDLSKIKFKENVKWIHANGGKHFELCDDYGNDILSFFTR